MALIRAETVVRRTLGVNCTETVTIMTNVLRMLIKCETKEGQAAAIQKAKELTRVIDKVGKKERMLAERRRKLEDR